MIVSVLESLRRQLKAFTLSSVIDEILRWSDEGRSCFARLLKKLQLPPSGASQLDRLLPLPQRINAFDSAAHFRRTLTTLQRLNNPLLPTKPRAHTLSARDPLCRERTATIEKQQVQEYRREKQTPPGRLGRQLPTQIPLRQVSYGAIALPFSVNCSGPSSGGLRSSGSPGAGESDVSRAAGHNPDHWRADCGRLVR